MEISDRIFNRRTELKLTKVALAKAIGVSDVTVGKWESGINQPKGRYLNDLADALGVSVDWLLTGSINPPISLDAVRTGERIRARRLRLDIDIDQLAKALDVPVPLVRNWERGVAIPEDGALRSLAKMLKVNKWWLSDGVYPPDDAYAAVEANDPIDGEGLVGIANVVPAELFRGRPVPVLSYVQAGQWREMCSQPMASDGNFEFVIPSVDVGPFGFGLWICGTSMTPIFNEGDLIVVDPEESPQPGDYVVAKNGSDEATFKKYRPRGVNEHGQDVFELVPLNDDFPILHSDRQNIQIIGVMVEHRIFRRRVTSRY